MFKKKGLVFISAVMWLWGACMENRALALGEVSFMARRELDIGTRPGPLALGDFNGDKIPDLAVSSIGTPMLSILLGNGDGTFQPVQRIGTRGMPGRVVTADFDGDDTLDLALGNGSILLGLGDGTFRSGPDFLTEGHASYLTIGDFNNDEVPDLAAAKVNSKMISIFLGNGDGTFRLVETPMALRHPTSIAVGDFNGDKIQDLIMCHSGGPTRERGTVSVLLGRGDGTFALAQSVTAGIEPSSATVGDFNGDKLMDVAVTNFYSRTVSILLGNGDGTLREPLDLELGGFVHGLRLADFDGDAIPDLAVMRGEAVLILLGNGDGTFRSGPILEVGKNPSSIGIEDFNGDHVPDLAVSNPGDSSDPNPTLSILLGAGDGAFRSAPSLEVGISPQFIAVGDFNGDQIQDLAVANWGSDMARGTTISILTGNGDGTFRQAQTVGVGTSPSSIAVGDFNADGIPDLAVTNSNSNNVSILIGKGSGTFAPARNVDVGIGPRFVTIADLNGDARLDLVVANTSSNNLSLLMGNGDGTFQDPQVIKAGSRQWSVAVGDFNGDGMQDLAVANEDANNVSVLIGNGDGTFRSVRNYAVGIGPRAVAVGDFNRDGVQDLAVANWGSTISRGTTVSILLGLGDGTFQPARNVTVPGNPGALVVADFNGDGIQDLAVTNWGFIINPRRQNIRGKTISILLGLGDGTFQAVEHFGVRSNPSSVAVGDFNGDGRQDLAVTNAGSNSVSILLNDTQRAGR